MPISPQDSQTGNAILFGFLASAFGAFAFSIALGQLILGIGLLLFIGFVVTGRVELVLPRAGWLVLIFAVLCFLSAWYGVNREEGMRNVPGLIWLLAMPMAASVVTSTERLHLLMRSFVVGNVILSLVILIGNPLKAIGHMADEKPWTIGANGEPDLMQSIFHVGSMTDGQMLMMGLLCAIALFFAARADGRSGYLWIGAFVLLAAAFVLNGKRGSWLCALGLIALFLLFRANWRVTVAFAALALIVALLPPVQNRLDGLKDEWGQDRGGRYTMWTKIMPGMIKDHPNGIGYGNMTNELMREYAENVEPDRNHLHSNIVNLLAETGWLGLVLYGGITIWGLLAAVLFLVHARQEGPTLTVLALATGLSYLGLFANGLIEYNIGDSELLVIYSVWLGILCSPVPMHDTGHSRGSQKFSRYEIVAM